MSLELSQNGPIARLTINREAKRNALTMSMWQQLSDYCDQLLTNPPKVLIVDAVGNKAFSAGADIEELTEIIQDEARQIENNKVVQQAQLKLQQLPFATIAVVQGACVGGGLGIALCCDFRVVANNARFGITPAKLGLLYSVEDTKRVIDLVGLARAKELLYLGKIIDAKTASAWGLVSEVVTSENLSSAAELLVEQLLSASSYSISGIKKTMEYITQSAVHDEAAIRAMFEQAFSEPDFKEGAAAFLAKRKPSFNQGK